MAFTYFDFRFKFLDSTGKGQSRMYKRGHVGDEGITLDGALLNFKDILDTARDYNELAIILYPAIASESTISNNVLPGTQSLILRIDTSAFEVKSYIDRKLTEVKLQKKREEMLQDGQIRNFRTEECTNCRANLDLSFLADTQNIYCRYCETIFNRHGHIMPGIEDYATCKECGYYALISHYGAQSKRGNECCINCARDILSEEYIKPLGKTLHFFGKARAQQYATPQLSKLDEANRMAVAGKIDKAEKLYESMIERLPDFPGLHYNLGKAYLEASEALSMTAENKEDLQRAEVMLSQAAEAFKKSLEVCANYEPTFVLLKRRRDVAFIVQEGEEEE